MIHHERDVREEQKYMWREQAIIESSRWSDLGEWPLIMLVTWWTIDCACKQWRREWSRRVISIVACCHGAKLCAHAPRDFRSQQNGAVTRMWRSCGVRTSHKERAIGVVRCKKEWMLLQPLRWCCVNCMIHHERDVREEQKYMYVARTNNNRVISSGDLYCCLLPRCEALRTCRSGFPIATAKYVYLIILFRGDFFERVLKMEFGFFNYTKKFIQSWCRTLILEKKFKKL